MDKIWIIRDALIKVAIIVTLCLTLFGLLGFIPVPAEVPVTSISNEAAMDAFQGNSSTVSAMTVAKISSGTTSTLRIIKTCGQWIIGIIGGAALITLGVKTYNKIKESK